MPKYVQTFGVIAAATSMAFATISSRALVKEDVLPTMPAGGWGYASGISSGMGAAYIELPGVTVVGTREDNTPVYSVYVPFAGIPPAPFLDSPVGGGQPDPAQQKACIDGCDAKQKLSKDLCDVAAAKASASGTTAAIGVGFAVGALLTWKGSIMIGAPAGFGAYLLTNQLAKDHAATMNLACIGKAAQDHMNCVTGVCKFTG